MIEKTKHTNFFLRYHGITHMFAERMRKIMCDKYDITPGQFTALVIGYMMQHKKGFFTTRFIKEVRKVHYEVAYRLVDILERKGFVEKGEKISHTTAMYLTKKGKEVMRSYPQLYITMIKEFEEEFWTLQNY